jgi:hypothetical protein
MHPLLYIAKGSKEEGSRAEGRRVITGSSQEPLNLSSPLWRQLYKMGRAGFAGMILLHSKILTKPAPTIRSLPTDLESVLMKHEVVLNCLRLTLRLELEQ